MFDVKSWLEPHLCEPLSHTEPLHFRFQAINDNDVKIHYKGLYNQSWIEYETGLFKSYVNGKNFLPKGTPKLLPPNLDHINFDRLKRQIHVIKHMFSKSEHIEWWDAFLDKITEKQYSQKAQWYLNLLPRQKKEKETEHTEDTLPPEIRKQLDKETKIPHVSTNHVFIWSGRGTNNCVVKTLVVMATYSFHWLIMGKVDIGNFYCLTADI